MAHIFKKITDKKIKVLVSVLNMAFLRNDSLTSIITAKLFYFFQCRTSGFAKERNSLQDPAS